jgi:hypothetical protein
MTLGFVEVVGVLWRSHLPLSAGLCDCRICEGVSERVEPLSFAYLCGWEGL